MKMFCHSHNYHVPILQTRKLRLKKVKSLLAWGHPTRTGQSRLQNPGFPPCALSPVPSRPPHESVQWKCSIWTRSDSPGLSEPQFPLCVRRIERHTSHEVAVQ